MLSLLGNAYQNCDGLSRRSFLTAGACGFAGLTLADLLRAESAAGIGSSNKAVINVHLDGGPPQMDMIDPKPLAPTEIRGEFLPIATKLPSVQFSELMPQLAAHTDKFAFVRSLVESAGRHDAFQCQSGYSNKDLASIGGRPAMGSVVSKLKGQPTDKAPAFVDIMQGRPLVRNSGRPGFLGPSFQGFRPDISELFHRELEAGMKNELKAKGADHTTSLTLDASLTARRLNDRTQLLAGLDSLRRDVDASGMMSAMDSFTQQAVGILTSGRLAAALDLSQEDPSVLAQYTPKNGVGADDRFVTAEGPDAIRKFLLARRLIEAGVRCVSVTISDFDTHSKNFSRMRELVPYVDHGLHALVTDLENRGMLDDVSIVVWGEFGRTPRINKNGGRDHWPRVGPAILAGGGMQGGQVIGATDRSAGAPTERPVTYKDIFATLYRNLGIDALDITIDDPHGRPQYILDAGQPLRELS
jgi:hypothetical protein